ncbi:MAG: hypothetical protein OXU35_11125 [Acidobacteriota bacterium]|nr:hypothetical protein [Acidobacteriota bacterium]
MNRPADARGPNPKRWHFVVALAPIVLAALALGGLLLFHCGGN